MQISKQGKARWLIKNGSPCQRNVRQIGNCWRVLRIWWKIGVLNEQNDIAVIKNCYQLAVNPAYNRIIPIDIIFKFAQVINFLKPNKQRSMSGQRIVKHESEVSISEQQQNIFKKEQSRLNTIVWMNMLKKQVMAVGFSGVIRSGIFKDENTLSVMYSLYSGADWKIVGGQPSGISMKSACTEEKIVWNFPFGVSYQAKTLHEWPQIVVILYGTDYFGRSVPRGYGNVHLPTAQGMHNRKIRIFKPLQPTSLWACLNFFTSSVMQISQAQKFLASSKQRKNLKVQFCGQIELEVQTRLVNLSRHGYK